MVSVFFYLPPFPRTVKDSENVLTPSPLNYIPRALARGVISLLLTHIYLFFPSLKIIPQKWMILEV